ncbi:MAG TPA: ChrR family anti-sigma-E factor [Cellvibrionaceae bacterium]
MISHHPDTNLLVEFANGSCDWALAILINTHLEHCRHCRSQLFQLEQFGAALLTSGPQVAVEETCFEKLWQRIEELPVNDSAEAISSKKLKPPFSNTPLHKSSAAAKTAVVKADTNQPQGLPAIVQRLVNPQARWQKISKNLTQLRLKTGQNKYEVALQSIKSGGQVSAHDHRGMEYTVVLQGSFSDVEGIYCVGDFVKKQPGQIHKPTASQNEDCLCLSAVEQPVRLTHWLGRLINPFLRVYPA